MIRKNALTIGSICGSLLLIGAAFSQEDDGPNVVIVEIYGCNYSAGNDMDDFLAVAERWNAWADDNDVTEYSATVLTPHLYSPAFPYDLVWLGVYPTGEAMGAGDALWLSQGGELRADFGEVSSCSVHAQFAGLAAHIPENPPESSDDSIGLIAFQDCTLHDERIIPDALSAHGEWGDHMAENGSDVFMGMLIPLAGENPDSEYNYKAITGFASPQAYGQYVGTVVGGAFQRAIQLFGRVVDCDLPRVYATNNIREMAGDDE